MRSAVAAAIHKPHHLRKQAWSSSPPDETRLHIAEYETAIRSGQTQPGSRFAKTLTSEIDFTTDLLRTKLPQILAESADAGAAGTGT